MSLEYFEGASVLHRVPALAKLALLIVLGIWLARCTTISPVLISLAILAGCYWWIAGSRRLSRVLVLVAFLMAPSIFYMYFSLDPALTFTRGVAIAATVVASCLLTATTSPTQLLSALNGILAPLIGTRRALWFSLGVSLCLRFIPMALHTVTQTRDAARARNISLTPWNVFIPTLIRLTSSALVAGDAIETRHITK